jgi:hypothetical protein
MDQVDNERVTSQDIVAYAREQAIDLEPFHIDGSFLKDQRWICLWRKRDDLPCSGRAEEEEGTLHYNLQGSIDTLPSRLKDSASAFRGAWTEAGTLEDVEQAFGLVKAWFLDRKEVDDLPRRGVRRSGIG